MTAPAASAARRIALLDRLEQRNRVIGVLRIGVPVLGVLVLAGLVVQIGLASLGRDFGIAHVRFAGDSVVVDTPTYSGVMANGNVYRISAEAAQTALTSLSIIELRNATATVTRPDGTGISVHMPAADFNAILQIMTVPGAFEFADTAGSAGSVTNATFSLPAQLLQSVGPVSLRFTNGTTLSAHGMTFDARTGKWQFTGATLTVPDLPPEALP